MAEVEAIKERKIVIAVDEGEESMYALSWTIKNMVSENSNDTLILLYAKPPRVVYSSLNGSSRGVLGVMRDNQEGYMFSSDTMKTMEKYGKEVADCVIEKAKKICKDLNNVKVEGRIENGDARDVICEMVEKLGADVLILGTHGYGIIKRAFLGSVSTHCAQNVKCPVLIVRRPKTTAANN